MTTKVHAFARTALAALLSTAFAAQAADLDLAPASVTASVGSSFSLQVQGSSFVSGIIGGGFDLSYDPINLRLDSLLLDTTVWPDPARNAGLHDPASGTVTGVYFNSNAAVLPTGNFHVAQLNFTVLGGAANTVQLSPSVGLVWANEFVEEVAVSYGLAQINAVPEPASWGLMAAGLAMFGLRRLRRA